MTFTSRSRPLEETKPTARENGGQNTPHEAHEGRPAMGALQGATGTASLPPLKIKSRTIKRPQIKTTTSARTGDTNTCLRASKQEPYDFKTTAAKKRIRSWMI